MVHSIFLNCEGLFSGSHVASEASNSGDRVSPDKTSPKWISILYAHRAYRQETGNMHTFVPPQAAPDHDQQKSTISPESPPFAASHAASFAFTSFSRLPCCRTMIQRSLYLLSLVRRVSICEVVEIDGVMSKVQRR